MLAALMLSDNGRNATVTAFLWINLWIKLWINL